MALSNSNGSTGIGVFEKVTLNTPEISEYGGLSLTFTQKAAKAPEVAVASNLLDFMDQEVEAAGPSYDQENRITVYALKPTNYKGEALTQLEFGEENTKLKAQLNLIVTSYGLPELKFSPFDGITPTPTTFQDIMQEETLAKISGNYFTQFIKAMEKADLSKEFRTIFPRKSKNSKYPGLRNKQLKDFPFMEPMEVPVEKSKLKFLNTEIKNQLDKPLEVTPDTNTGGDVAGLFGVEAPAGELGLPFGA